MKSKKLNAVLSLLMVALFINCASTKITRVREAQEMGKYIFQIAQNFDNLTVETFGKYYMTVEEMREVSYEKQLVIDEKTRKKIRNTPPKRLKEQYEREYLEIQKRSEKLTLDWNKIEFLEYRQKEDWDFNFKASHGILRFTYNGDTYTFRSMAMYVGGEYKLLTLSLDRHKR